MPQNKKINDGENKTNKKVIKKDIKSKSKTKNKTNSKSTKSVLSSKSKNLNKKTKKIPSEIISDIEYYDLPYRYNETIVKIFFQKPKKLFVYWDISDDDRENYIKQYGENFFENTSPFLKVTNKDKNYSFEIEINDFANSWYFDVRDSNCIYSVELLRHLNNYIDISGKNNTSENKNDDNKNYIFISSSNDIYTPNDHILFESLQTKIKFKNIKTGDVFYKDIELLDSLKLIGNKFDIYSLYDILYKDKSMLDLNNPSSNN